MVLLVEFAADWFLVVGLVVWFLGGLLVCLCLLFMLVFGCN